MKPKEKMKLWEVNLWNYLVKKCKALNDNNKTAREIFTRITRSGKQFFVN